MLKNLYIVVNAEYYIGRKEWSDLPRGDRAFSNDFKRFPGLPLQAEFLCFLKAGLCIPPLSPLLSQRPSGAIDVRRLFLKKKPQLSLLKKQKMRALKVGAR